MSEVPLYPPHPTQVLRELSSKSTFVARKVDVRLPGEGDSNSHGARPVQLMCDGITHLLRELSAKSLVFLVPNLPERVIRKRKPCGAGRHRRDSGRALRWGSSSRHWGKAPKQRS
jgi:hypothetical protein